MKGIVCINKPYGCTSFDVVARLRKIFKLKRIGHSGTLDPIATGVLPIFVGKATKAIQFLSNTDKSYLAGFKLGLSTDTLDSTGKLVCETRSEVDAQSLNEAIAEFKGLIFQVPPKYSAIKIGGTPAYKLARAGQEFKLNLRKVNVFEIKCVEFDKAEQTGKFFIDCSSGTYIRAICRDLGEKLGVGCILTSLVRTKACGWNLDDCYTLEDVENLSRLGCFDEFFLKIEDLFTDLERVNLNFQQNIKFINGARINMLNKSFGKGLLTVYFENKFLGLATIEKKELVVKKLFI